MRILFGHQSVGAGLLQGLAELPTADRPHLDIRDYSDPAVHSRSALIHFKVGTNGSPYGKLDDFTSHLDGLSYAVEVAMVKFCYVDLDDQRDSLPLLERYVAWTEQLRNMRPRLRIAHCSVPLRRASPGHVASVRRLLGQPDPELTRNLARQDYNERLRRFCRSTGQPLFDLALEESRTIWGRDLRYRQHGREIQAMRPSYSDDGGHLNERGRASVGRAFAGFLARMMGDARL